MLLEIETETRIRHRPLAAAAGHRLGRCRRSAAAGATGAGAGAARGQSRAADRRVRPAGIPVAVLAGLAQKDIIVIDQRMIRFEPTSRMAEISVPDGVEMQWISAEQSNSSVIVGDIAIIKMFRRVTDGPHPEAEMGRYLTENGFANTPALLGEVVRVDPDCTRHALAIAQAFVRNQGDAWTWTMDLLLRGLSDITGAMRTPRATRRTTPTTCGSPACWGSGWARCTWFWPAVIRPGVRPDDRDRSHGCVLRRTGAGTTVGGIPIDWYGGRR